MDKETRDRIQHATQNARALLEREYAEQLEGAFDIRLDGTIATAPGEHLAAAQKVLRAKLVAAVQHVASQQSQVGSQQEVRAADRKLQIADFVRSYVREAAFTTLNRFVALKMLEARGLVQECISRGEQSAGFKEFTGLAPGLVQLPDHGYRLYIESLFDEIGREVGILFDRRDPAGLLWPRRQALLDLLAVLNDPELARVQGSGCRVQEPRIPPPEARTLNPEPRTIWSLDETIGWVYQYFNGDEERKQMRAESQAPRNSRELAVRNQFFTPRYVVQFLTDNTLGRIWYEMRQGDTTLRDLDYLVLRPVGSKQYAEGSREKEVGSRQKAVGSGESAVGSRQKAVGSGESAVSSRQSAVGSREEELTQEEPPKRPAYVSFRAKRDPRDIRVLDPACGSGHFLLYAFDLLLAIYEEAWVEQYAVGSRQRAEGEEDEREELSGSDRMAEGDGSRGAGLRADEGVPSGGTLCTQQSASTSSGIHSVEHCRGAGANIAQGVHKLPVDRSRVDSRGRDAGAHRTASGLLDGGGSQADPGSQCGRGQADQGPDKLALQAIGYDYADSAYCPLPTAYPTLEALHTALPALILRHNLHGIDIDPRCAQIAALALWMRAQRAYKDLGVARETRPAIEKTNIVVAGPMPGEQELRREFIGNIGPKLGQLAERVFERMELAGEAGSLLRIEEDIREAVREIYREHGELFRVSDEERWQKAEEDLLRALRAYAEHTTNGRAYQRRLFVEDAARGLGFIDLCGLRYDVVLMNPPFGAFAEDVRTWASSAWPRTKNDIYAAFVERGIRLLHPRGLLGAITSRTGFFLSSFQKWREEILLKEAPPVVVADLGHGVMDDAMVEAAAYCLEKMERSSCAPRSP